MLPQLRICRTSKLSYFTFFVYLGSVIAIFNTFFPLYLKFILIIILCCSAKSYLQRYIFLSHPHAVIGLWKNQTFWSLHLQNQEIINGFLKPSSLITHFLLVLNFECEQSRKVTLILTPESLGVADYRRLLVYLNHQSDSHLR